MRLSTLMERKSGHTPVVAPFGQVLTSQLPPCLHALKMSWPKPDARAVTRLLRIVRSERVTTVHCARALPEGLTGLFLRRLAGL